MPAVAFLPRGLWLQQDPAVLPAGKDTEPSGKLLGRLEATGVRQALLHVGVHSTKVRAEAGVSAQRLPLQSHLQT